MVVNITFVFYDFSNMYMEFRINAERLRICASNETEAIDEKRRKIMKKNVTRVTAGVLSSALLVGMLATGVPGKVTAATEHWNDASQEATDWTNWKNNWEKYSSNYEHVSLTPGVDETQLNYAWYSHTVETPKVRIGTKPQSTIIRYIRTVLGRMHKNIQLSHSQAFHSCMWETRRSVHARIRQARKRIR